MSDLSLGGLEGDVKEQVSAAFARIPASTFPESPLGRVVEVSSDATVLEAVQTLSRNNILSAPVRDASQPDSATWADRYVGIVDFSAVVLWVLQQAELAAAALTAGTAAATGVGAGAVGAVGAVALGVTGPIAVASLTVAAVGTAIVGGLAAERGAGKDATTAADALGEDFFGILLTQEPFKSAKVSDITRSYRWAPFLAIRPDDSMLTVLLLLSKFRLRSVPVLDEEEGHITNMITQSAVVRGLLKCKGFDWFDVITEKTLRQLGLPVMAPDQVVTVDADRPVLEAFLRMKEVGVGGLPVVEGSHILYANISARDVQYLLLQSSLFHRRQELTVRDFIKIVSESAKKPAGHHAPMRLPVTCLETDTLLEIIETLASEQVHRVHVVDAGNKLLGVVTLRDIVSCFAVEPQGHFHGYLGEVVSRTINASLQ